MLTVLESREDISRAHDAMVAAQRRSPQAVRLSFVVGYHGEHAQVTGWYSRIHQFWWSNAQQENRYWDLFGLGRPAGGGYRNEIICEINSPYTGRNGRMQGVFARDPRGNLYLLHRGKIGGGRPKIGKELFVREFRGAWRVVADGSNRAQMALVGALSDPSFDVRVGEFVREVRRLKDLAVGRRTPAIPISRRFSPEKKGWIRYRLPTRSVRLERFHGSVVDALAVTLQNGGLDTWNSRAMDFVAQIRDSNTGTLFEVKTDTEPRSIYEGVGQLMINAQFLNFPPSLVIVVPKRLSRVTRNLILALDIQILTYGRKGRDVTFDRDPLTLVSRKAASQK